MTTFLYDAAGRRIAVIDANNHKTQFVYDARGRMTKLIYPDQTVREYGYDLANRLLTDKDEMGKVTRNEYNLRGDLQVVIDALNQRTEYAYDQTRNLSRIRVAPFQDTGFNYDGRNLRVVRSLPNGTTDVLNYNEFGQLRTKRDFNNKTTTWNYDNMRGVQSIVPDATLTEPTISFTYKPNGQRATMTDASGVTTYGYDNRDRLTSKATPFGTLSYSYDAANNVTSTQSNNANGLSVSYRYDAVNRLDQVTDNRITPGVTSYQYDDTHNLSRTVQANGVQSDYSYNAVDLLTQLTTNRSATTVARYDYSYTPSRLRTTMTELSGRTVQYEYDDAQRLVKETIASALNSSQNGTVGYVMDGVGNRLQRNSSVAALPSTTNSYNSVDRLNTDSYDANGNTTQGDGKTFTSDFRDKIKTVNANVGIVYDGNGNRVSKTVSGVTTNYLVDEINPTGYSQVVEELVGGQVRKVYTYGTMLLQQRQLVGASWVTHYYGYDGSGNVRYLTDGNGVVTDTWDYDAYGVVIGRTGTTANNYLYRGQQFDGDLGYYYQRARYYSEARGRFLTMDLFEGFSNAPKSLHKYQYADSDPINLLDFTGYATGAEYGIASKEKEKTQVPAYSRVGRAIKCVIKEVVIAILMGIVTDAVRDVFESDSTSSSGQMGSVVSANGNGGPGDSGIDRDALDKLLAGIILPPKGEKDRFRDIHGILDQLDDIVEAQDNVRGGKGGVIIDDTTKSKHRVRNALKGIKNLGDAIEEWEEECEG